jgi:hypothetical protein
MYYGNAAGGKDVTADPGPRAEKVLGSIKSFLV